MPRQNKRKTALSLENLETRNLQSALSVGANVAAVGAVARTSAIIVLSSKPFPGVHTAGTQTHGAGGAGDSVGSTHDINNLGNDYQTGGSGHGR
jgi:hypothetical protein